MHAEQTAVAPAATDVIQYITYCCGRKLKSPWNVSSYIARSWDYMKCFP